jgi:hypothetical protein
MKSTKIESGTPAPRTTTPDYTNKQMQLMGASAAACSNLLVALARLMQCNNLLAQSGGNFDDAVFTAPSQFVYCDAYHADVLLQQAAPALDAFLDTPVNNDSGLPSYRQLFQTCAQGPY